MKKIQIIVELEIDDSYQDVDIILSEMDYSFSYVIMDEDIGKQLIEKELILNTEILEQISYQYGI